jgi:hypothetical protein
MILGLETVERIVDRGYSRFRNKIPVRRYGSVRKAGFSFRFFDKGATHRGSPALRRASLVAVAGHLALQARSPLVLTRLRTQSSVWIKLPRRQSATFVSRRE